MHKMVFMVASFPFQGGVGGERKHTKTFESRSEISALGENQARTGDGKRGMVTS